MDKEVITILNLLLKLVNITEQRLTSKSTISDTEEKCLIYGIKNDISNLYMSLHGQEQLFQLLENNFSDDVKSQIFLLSVLLKCTHDIQIIENIVRLIKKSNLDPYYCSLVEYQIVYELFSNSYPQELIYKVRRELHSFNVNNFKDVLNVPVEYQPYRSRNKNRVVIVAEQLLDIKHAPTKVILEHCYTLKKCMGMDVLLFVCPIALTYEDWFIWYEIIRQNYSEALNGAYIIKYENGEIQFAQKESDGNFCIQYRDAVFKGKQVLFTKENLPMQTMILNIIKEYNPLFVYNINSLNPIADLCSSFTTVASSSMNYGYPVSDAQILLCLDNSVTPRDNMNTYTVLEDTKQVALKYKWHFEIDEPKSFCKKSDFGIQENEFIIAIVGNRLSIEITEEFIQLLERILRIDARISIMIVGEYPEPYEKLKATIFQNRVHALGYQDKLAEVLHAADIFINPPRIGGGTSALYALYVGVPVITLPDCDVAYNVGKDFICQSNEEIIETVKEYITNHKYYEQQSKLGIEYTHSLSDLTKILKSTVSQIEHVIDKIEEGDIFENKF